ncbi:MAG TPA: LPS export ABC transporter permease LptF [Geminicoccaceae bacterium]|nr:LPS export ABC transporter permease LptF [Geminicoccaceae bacterium]
MIKLVDQYLLRKIIATSLVMTGVGLAVLLLERLLRLFGLVANPNKAFSFVGQMLVLLTPHYLSVALPAAFFFGVLLTFLRLRQDNELVVLSSVGQGLHRLIAPAMGLAVVMTAIAVLILGFLSPHARYAYRVLKNSVAEASLNAAVREGTFIQADGLTFFAEGSVAGDNGLQLSKVFVYEEASDGASIVTTGTQGVLGQTGEDRGTILKLKDGVRAELPPDNADARTLTFSDLSWPVATGEVAAFRPRGGDQRELTLPELWRAQPSADGQPSAEEIAAELNSRLVIIATVPLLPLLAASLAIVGRPRSERRSALFIGLAILIVYYETLSFGESLVKNGMLSPAVALWVPFAVLAVGTAVLYARAWLGHWPRLRRRPARWVAAPVQAG